MAYKKTCEVCKVSFTSSWDNTKTCSKKCRIQKNKTMYGYYTKSLPNNFLGRMNEYKVMLDLAMKGYDVFSAVFPQQHYDLVIYERTTGEITKVEVKTGYMRENGKVTVPKHRHKDWDIMAVVIQAKNSIVYFDKNENILFV